MSTKRTDKCCYQSRYGKTPWTTAAAWLAELLCERQAKLSKTSLTQEFWKQPAWKKEFVKQVAATNNLLRLLDPEKTGSGVTAIARFLRSDRGRNIYSLTPAFVISLVAEVHKRLLEESEV